MEIKTAEFLISSSRADQCPPTGGKPEYAFIGRSNVGKSSLINMLTRRKGLAMTSATPGKTLLINHFSINDGEWFLVDLPGYGYAKRGKKEMERLTHLISHYVCGREELTCLFVLIDSRLTPQKIDLEFIEWLGEEGVPFAIVFTKADKNKAGELRKNVDAFLSKLREKWEEPPPHFITSSTKLLGLNEFLDYVSHVNASLKTAPQAEPLPEAPAETAE